MENNQYDYIIELQDGNPINHPIFISNFKEVYPEIDLNNLPENWVFFVRTPIPNDLGIPEPFTGPISTYIWDETHTYITDSWSYQPLSQSEKNSIVLSLIDNINNSLRLINYWSDITIDTVENKQQFEIWANNTKSIILENPPGIITTETVPVSN